MTLVDTVGRVFLRVIILLSLTNFFKVHKVVNDSTVARVLILQLMTVRFLPLPLLLLHANKDRLSILNDSLDMPTLPLISHELRGVPFRRHEFSVGLFLLGRVLLSHA